MSPGERRESAHSPPAPAHPPPAVLLPLPAAAQRDPRRLLSCSAGLSPGLTAPAGSAASASLGVPTPPAFEVCLLPLDEGAGRGGGVGVKGCDCQARTAVRSPQGEVAAQPSRFPRRPVGGARCQPRPSCGLAGATAALSPRRKGLSCQLGAWRPSGPPFGVGSKARQEQGAHISAPSIAAASPPHRE